MLHNSSPVAEDLRELDNFQITPEYPGGLWVVFFKCIHKTQKFFRINPLNFSISQPSNPARLALDTRRFCYTHTVSRLVLSVFFFSCSIFAACPTVAYWGGTGTAIGSTVAGAGGYADAIFTVPTVVTGCSWSVSFSGNFITFEGATSGTITGTTFPFSYIMPANTGSTPRQGDLVVTIDGTVAFSLTIIENPASCVFTVSPPSVNVPATGGGGSFMLTSTPPGCGSWSSDTGPSGLVLSPAGPQAVSWSVTANTGAARQWVITETYAPGVPSNATFTINQAAVGTTGGLAVNCNPSYVPMDYNAYSVNPYSTTCTATGGVPPYTFSQGPGTLPPGLTFQTSGGTATIQGVSVVPGTYQYSVKATDSASNTVTYLFSGIQPPAQLLVSFPASPPPTVAGFGTTGSVQGGTRPYSWSVIAGALPAGLTLTSSGTSVTVSGSIVTPQSYNYTLQVSDSGTPPLTKTQAYSGTIAVTPLTIYTSTTPLPGGRVNLAYIVDLSAGGGTPPYTWSLAG
jgi:large repetitive protein